MPIDPETGEFQYDRQPMAGPGNIGPLGGLLQVMNAVKGQNLANQIQGQRQLGNLGLVQRLGVSGMDYSSPEGQSALQSLGVSPQTASSLVESAPTMRVRSALAAYSQAHPGEAIPSQVLEQAYIGAGLNPPAGLWGYASREAGIAGAGDREMFRQVGQAYKTALQGADTDMEARRKAASMATAMHPEWTDKLEAWVAQGSNAPTPYAETRRKTTEERGTAAAAQAELAKAHARYFNIIADPTAKARMAQAGLADAHTAITNTLEQIDQIRLHNGGVLPGVEAEKDENELLNIEKTIGVLMGKSFGLSPAEKQTLQDSTAKLIELRTKIENNLVTAKGRTAAARKWSSPEEVRDAANKGEIDDAQAVEILRSQFPNMVR